MTKKTQGQKFLLNQRGKKWHEWQETRKQWILENPADHSGYWYCVVGGGYLDSDMLQLDHDISRSRDTTKRNDLANLNPMCGKHNTLKGSKTLQEFRDSKPSLRCHY